MIAVMTIQAQSRFGLTGVYPVSSSGTTLLTPMESLPWMNLPLKDWGFMLDAGAGLNGDASGQLNAISLAKREGSHSFLLRYTPGYIREFSLVKSDQYLSGTGGSYLTALLQYRELFGAGYGYEFDEDFSAGVTMRNFSRKTEDNSVGVVFTSDTLYLLSEKETVTRSRWQFDLGASYRLLQGLMINLSSHNLYLISQETEGDIYNFSDAVKFSAGADWKPFASLGVSFAGESDGSLLAGVWWSGGAGKVQYTAGSGWFYDNNSSDASGFQPSAAFRYGNAGLSAGAVIYTKKRTSSQEEFERNRITSLINDGYSGDRFTISLQYFLEARSSGSLTVEDVTVIENIYTSLAGEYAERPFASALVRNLSGKPLRVRIGSAIQGYHEQQIFSPAVYIPSGDTLRIPVYTLVTGGYNEKKSVLAQVKFSFYAGDEGEPEEEIVKPVLLYGVNAWNGRTKDLNYFIGRDIQELGSRAKQIISDSAGFASETQQARQFAYIRGLYQTIAKGLSYVSDPLATSDYVQFPLETMQVRGGDCDDLSVLFAALYESIGIETALIDYSASSGMRHVTVMVNTGLFPEEAWMITSNEQKYFIKKDIYGDDRVWIPLEVTEFRGFNESWEAGAERFSREAIQEYGLVKGTVTLIDVY
ncbi:MAG: hypothetical protein L6Q47_08075 [Ignavibacteriaceae bacterium]|nr:hypothetical protein [Ignavibacteriaceae bacterium]